MQIRPYSKQELAMLYFPHSTPRVATNHLMRWINRSRELLSLLEERHYTRSSKYFTSTQVRAIVDHLGEP